MKILVVMDAILPGGAEIFALRSAQFLQEAGNEVEIFAIRKKQYDDAFKNLHAPGIKVHFSDNAGNKFLKNVDSALLKTGIDANLYFSRISRDLVNVIKQFKPAVLHSHLFHADKITLAAARRFKGLPVFTTIHGDYLRYFTTFKKKSAVKFNHYLTHARKQLAAVEQVVIISEEQRDFFQTNFPAETNGKLVKIYYGHPPVLFKEEIDGLKKEIGISTNTFVFGMVARPDPTKGWKIAIEAFSRIKNDNACLLLIGGGKYLDELKEQYAGLKNIYFLGYKLKPIEYIRAFDVGLLPTTYGSESLPNTVIEYLYCHKPVIGSTKGEIQNMITAQDGMAGFIMPIENGQIDTDDVAFAMQSYLNDPEMLAIQEKLAEECAAKFNMDSCTQHYLDLYQSALSARK